MAVVDASLNELAGVTVGPEVATRTFPPGPMTSLQTLALKATALTAVITVAQQGLNMVGDLI